MPTLEDVLEKVGPCKVVSNMSQGFHQIEVDQRSRDNTTFVTQYGRSFWSKKRSFCVSAING